MRRALVLTALACAAVPGPAAAQEPEAVQESAPEPAPRKPPKPRVRSPARPAADAAAKPPADKPATDRPTAEPAARPAAVPQPPALSLDAYAEAAATTIIAEQSCEGVRLNAGQLTNLRLAARVAPGQEPVLEEKLRGRAGELRQSLAADGREAWCAGALDAFGPAGTVAKGVLTSVLTGMPTGIR